MRTQIFYLNDERKNISVRIMDRNYDAATSTGDSYMVLKPAEGRMFELDIPDDCSIYVKKWEELVLISYIFLPEHGQPDEQLPRSGAV
jgi:hypothetical protein